MLLLAASVVTFVRKSTMDRLVVLNRDKAAQAEALARGGIRLAQAIIVADAVPKGIVALGGDAGDEYVVVGFTGDDLWARAKTATLETQDGGTLHLTIFDRGSHLNLNALVPYGDDATVPQETEEFLVALLERIIDEIQVGEAEVRYDPRRMAESLLDYIDADDSRQRGGSENDYYLSQDPPYEAPNRPLLSVDELRMIEGFDRAFVEALRPYVTVFPLAGGGGIDLNTAPPHVLSLLFHDGQWADEDTIRRILDTRAAGRLLCTETAKSDRCDPVSEVVPGARIPDASLPIEPSTANTFTVLADAQVGEIRRRVEAVIETGKLPETRLLSWRLR